MLRLLLDFNKIVRVLKLQYNSFVREEIKWYTLRSISVLKYIISVHFLQQYLWWKWPRVVFKENIPVDLLQIILQDNFSVNLHVNYVLSLCSPRIFLLKRLRDYRQLDIVFQAIVVSRILYALPGWGPFLSKELTGRIDAFLKRAFR